MHRDETTLEDRIAMLEQHRKTISELRKLNHNLEQKIADEKCPFKVGERIICTKSNSWSNPIDNGDEVEVARISYLSIDHGYELRVHRIKKNGELYHKHTDCLRNMEFEAKP